MPPRAAEVLAQAAKATRAEMAPPQHLTLEALAVVVVRVQPGQLDQTQLAADPVEMACNTQLLPPLHRLGPIAGISQAVAVVVTSTERLTRVA